jgi:FAD/FMN-containing dehydrogenase
VRFDAFTRGRYATDASIYQIMPMGVVMPKTADDSIAPCRDRGGEGVPVIARGGGTSQNGQPIGEGLVVDCSRHLNGVLDYDREAREIRVEPGMVLERLNARLRATGCSSPSSPPPPRAARSAA